MEWKKKIGNVFLIKKTEAENAYVYSAWMLDVKDILSCEFETIISDENINYGKLGTEKPNTEIMSMLENSCSEEEKFKLLKQFRKDYEQFAYGLIIEYCPEAVNGEKINGEIHFTITS